MPAPLTAVRTRSLLLLDAPFSEDSQTKHRVFGEHGARSTVIKPKLGTNTSLMHILFPKLRYHLDAWYTFSPVRNPTRFSAYSIIIGFFFLSRSILSGPQFSHFVF